MEQVGRGDTTRHLPVSEPPDELDELCGNINRMIDSLSRTASGLHDSEENHKRIGALLVAALEDRSLEEALEEGDKAMVQRQAHTIKGLSGTIGASDLQFAARELDTAIATSRDNDLMARYGGEEFVCLLPGTDARGAAIVGERLRNAILELEIPHGYSSVAPYITLSLGAATKVPDRAESGTSLIEQADCNLYTAKERGRNRLQT